MLKNKIIKQVEEEFIRKQDEIKRLQKQNYLENLKNEDFMALDKEIRNLNIEIAEKTLNGVDCKKLEAELKRLKEKQDELRLNANITFECTKCKDTGKVEGKPCSCFNRRVSELLVKESGAGFEILKHFADSDFSKFERPEEIKKVYQVFEKILDGLDKTKYKNFLIQGDSGVGKTFLLSAIAGESIERGHTMFFVTAFNLNALMLKYHTTFEQDRIKFLAPIFESDVLIIDDLGTEQILRNITKEYLLEILKTRVIEGKHTFISTNLSLDGIIDRYGERIFSRMVDKSNSLTLRIENKNLRLKK